jgi:hypothetical protein
MLGTKKAGRREGRKNVNNEELHNLYSSPNIIKMFKSKRIRWTGDVLHVVMSTHLKKMHHVDDSDVDGRIICSLS